MASSDSSLYHRLGGYDALAVAVDDLLPRLQGDFLVQALGGPAMYQGLDMKAAHEGLNITESDWAVMERHAVAVLDKFGIQGREREEFLGAAASLKGDIVQGH